MNDPIAKVIHTYFDFENSDDDFDIVEALDRKLEKIQDAISKSENPVESILACFQKASLQESNSDFLNATIIAASHLPHLSYLEHLHRHDVINQ